MPLNLRYVPLKGINSRAAQSAGAPSAQGDPPNHGPSCGAVSLFSLECASDHQWFPGAVEHRLGRANRRGSH
jgi:hypothetical protein